MRSWVLEGSLISPLFKNELNLIPKDEHRLVFDSSSEMIPFTEDDEHHCKQFNTVPGTTDLGKPRTKRYSTTPASEARGTWCERKQKDFKNQRTRRSAVPPRNDCPNKT